MTLAGHATPTIAPRPARRRPCRGRAAQALALSLALALAAGASLTSSRTYAQAPGPSQAEALARRAAARIQALQREADALASRERTLLGDLRALEVERDLHAARLDQVQADLARLEAELADAASRIAALEATVQSQQPAVAARMVELYKLGNGGYLRLLLSVDDLRSMGRAYRFVSALQGADRLRIAEHQRTLAELRRAETALSARREQLLRAQDDGAKARAASARAAAAHEDLLRRIDARRDLAAQLAGELQTARTTLQRTIDAAARGDAASGTPALPLRPFKGDLDWPAPGELTGRFGRRQDGRLHTSTLSNGIRIAAAPATPARAIHDGTVTFAEPFPGLGNLVIVDHGALAFSLYGYLADVQVAPGAHVARGDTVGSTGLALDGAPALYFELRIDARPVDPLQWLKPR